MEEDMRNGKAVSEEGVAEDGIAAGDRAANIAGFSGRVGTQQLIDRTDYLRLLQQAMRKLGYKATAERLERESVSSCQPKILKNSPRKANQQLQQPCSAPLHAYEVAGGGGAVPQRKGVLCQWRCVQGVNMQPDEANRLQEAVMEGRFEQAVQLLPLLMQGPHLLKQVCPIAMTLLLHCMLSPQKEAGEKGRKWGIGWMHSCVAASLPRNPPPHRIVFPLEEDVLVPG